MHEGGIPVKKPITIVTNGFEIARRLQRRCKDKMLGEMDHSEHYNLMNGTAKRFQVYPRMLCYSILEGIAAQPKHDKGKLQWNEMMSVQELELIAEVAGLDIGSVQEDAEELLDEEGLVAFDDVSGDERCPSMVHNARAEELQYFKEMGVYEYASIEGCLRTTHRAPISTRWIDVNKGDRSNLNFRSRLAAREFKLDEKPELFATTPPTEALKILLSPFATNDADMKLLYADGSRAYFYATSIRPTFIKLPAEDPKSNDPKLCGRLRLSVYGTRDAAQNWHQEYARTLIEAGYVRGTSNPCLVSSEKDKVALLVHGDDFAAVGPEAPLEKLRAVLSNNYKVKTEMLGGGREDAKEVRVLNRVVQWRQDGIALEADPRHIELIVKEFGIEKVAATPGDKEQFKKETIEHKQKNDELEGMEATKFRAAVARLNYVCSERPDIQYSTKELARSMTAPTVFEVFKLKRLARYLKGRPRLQIMYKWQYPTSELNIYIYIYIQIPITQATEISGNLHLQDASA